MTVRLLRMDDPQPSPVLVPVKMGPAEWEASGAEVEGDAAEADAELCLYRGRTVILLRRYLRMSLEAGRLPSLLGREFFGTHFTGYQAHTFEDVVIFVHDVETSLEELEEQDRKLIAMIALQEHTQAEVAHLLGYTRRSVVRQYAQALDRVSEIFLRRQIMERFPGSDPARENSCQEGENDDFRVSDCDNDENNS